MRDTAGVIMLERNMESDWGAEEARALSESIMTTAPGRDRLETVTHEIVPFSHIPKHFQALISQEITER